MLSKSLEDYLKTSYILKKQGEEIKVTSIAQKMGVSKPSVNKAINHLKNNGLVNMKFMVK